MTKGRFGVSICILRYGWKEFWYTSVEPNEEVRMGNGSVRLRVSLRPRVKPQIPPLRFAPVGMTKGRLAFPKRQGWLLRKGGLAFTKGRVGFYEREGWLSQMEGLGLSICSLRYGWKGFGTHPSKLSTKCEWKRAIGIPKA
jgi:hypothetical protein